MRRALEMEGVERVITAADVPGNRYVGLIVNDWPILVAIGEETRCVGDIIAVVVARDQYIAQAGGRESCRRLRRAHSDCHHRRSARAGRAADSPQRKFTVEERDCARQPRRSICQCGARGGRHLPDAAHRAHVFGAGIVHCDAVGRRGLANGQFERACQRLNERLKQWQRQWMFERSAAGEGESALAGARHFRRSAANCLGAGLAARTGGRGACAERRRVWRQGRYEHPGADDAGGGAVQ